MVDAINGVVIGTKLAVFFVILIYVILINATSRSNIHYSINIFAGALILVSAIKFFTVFLEIEPIFATQLLTSLLSLIAGLGLISFLSYINKNIKDYR